MVVTHPILAADEEGAKDSDGTFLSIAHLSELVGPEVQDAAKDLGKGGEGRD